MVVFTAEQLKDCVYDMAFSPDESTFLYRSSNTVCICDSETGHCISSPFEVPEDRNRASFSPSERHILFRYDTYAILWDIERGEERLRIKGHDFAFVHHDGRIVSARLFNGDKNLDDTKDQGANRILIEFWDASNGALISNKLLEVNKVGRVKFSPDGHFLAIVKKSKNVIKLWSLEDSKYFRRFTYFRGKLSFLRFSPTSDTLMAAFEGEPRRVRLWRLDTQEMVSFSHNFGDAHVIHSPHTNYLFIQQDDTVEIWDVSATGSKMIWEIKPASTSWVNRICPSCDGHRVLVGYGDGSVRMWNLDLENLAINQADTTDTRDDANVRRVITISPSGKMVVARSQQSSNVEFLDTTTGEVVARTDIEYNSGMEIAFSSDEEQVAFLSKSLITIWDIMHVEKRVSFNPWPGKDVWKRKVAFQTCNDLVICAISHDFSGLLQVWHRQDPAGFECTYSLDIAHAWKIFLASDGLTVIVPHSPSPTRYSWNHETAQFDSVHFDDQEHIPWYHSPAYSPDGKLFAYRSDNDSHVRVWDTQTGHLVSKFPTPEVDTIVLSPALIDHSLGERLIALRYENAIGLFDAYTGHLHAQILGQASAYMTFIRDGTALAYHSPKFGLRIWDIADLVAEHWHPTHGYELMSQAVVDGWVMGKDDKPLFWVPVEHREHLCMPPFKMVIEGSQLSTILELSNSRLCKKWTECIDKGWLRELEEKEKEVGNLLE